MASITGSQGAVDVLSGYTVREVVFESDSIRVYRAFRDKDGLPVALKALRDGQQAREAIAGFQREYEMLRRLRAEHAIRAHALEWRGSLPVIVMEDAGGQSLDGFAAHRGLTLEEILTIGIEVAAGLSEIHAGHIIHKDINPSNIIYNERTGAVRIIDFGIAAYLAQEQAYVAASQANPGTLEYMAPEQTGRMNRSVDYRADLYSLGATLYELLTRRRLFDASEPIEWFHCHIARKPQPPVMVDESIPLAVSAIVMKLLEKTAEDRYQSARGVRIDLQHCLEQLRARGRIESFPLARHDASGQFQIPQRLYGRERELDELMSAFERARLGDACLVLVLGPPGIGKSRLIEEIYKPVAAQQGYLVKGKFDQAHRDIPYGALRDALRELVCQLLTESDDQILVWKNKILDVLGSNAQLMIDLIEALELIIGPQAPVPPLPPVESEQRFMLALLSFVRGFGREGHPLVLVLHDLQWADAGSLRLIEMLAGESENNHLLVIGTYNDQEAHFVDSLAPIQSRLHAQNASVSEIVLRPLQLEDLGALLADTLQAPMDKVEPLARLVDQKTAGNPFFVEEFLGFLRQQGLIVFNGGQGCWEWDLERIRLQQITDNVVELMASRLQRLSETSLQLLRSAACIGIRFPLSVLTAIAELPPPTVVECLLDAAMEGLIAPVGGSDQLFELAQAAAMPESAVEFSFAHDRVQQAAYSLLDEAERLATHLRIGRALQSRSLGADQEGRLFELVRHLNIAAALMESRQERMELCRLNLAAGKRTKSAASYKAAFEYMGMALALFDSGSWEDDYALALELHTEAAEAAYLSGNHEALETLLETGLRQARDLLDKTALYQVRISALIARGELLQAVKLAKPVLAELGHVYPAKPNRLHLAVKLLALKYRLRGMSMDDIRRLPPMTDPRHLAAMSVGERIGSAAFFAEPLLLPLMVLHAVQISLDHGYAPQTHSTYASFGMILAGVLGEVDRGQDFGRLALELCERPQAKGFAGRTLHVYSSLVQHWKEPLRNTLQPLREARQQCLEGGDFEYAIHAASVCAKHALAAGSELQQLQDEVASLLATFRPLRQGPLLYHLECFQQMALNLRGHGDDPARLVGAAYDIDSMLPQHEQATDRTILFTVHYTQMYLSYLFGDYERAVEHARKMRVQQEAVQGFYSTITSNFLDSLSHLGAAIETNDPSLKRRLLRRVARNQSKLRRLAGRNSANCLNKYVLIQAERLRVQGRDFEAHAAYDRAIALARKEGVLQEQALANELCGSMHMRAGRNTLGEPYLIKARELYHRWGAVAKVRDLESRFPELARGIRESGTRRATMAVYEDVNITSLMKALKVIASEHVHSRMVTAIMRAAMEFAGAQYGALALRNPQGELCIEVEEEVDTAEIRVLQSQPLAQSATVSQAVVNYVARTRESLVVNDALAADSEIPGLSLDEHVRRHRVRSILCLPIMAGAGTEADLIGMLYLENNRASNSFTSERFDMLEIICVAAAGRLELSRKAAVDSLTNLFNHDYFQNMLKQEVAAASRHKRELTLILLDIDHFKRFNDTWGHQVGDRVLREVADLIRAGSREGDTVARYGGEEIAVILPGARMDEARMVAERLRRSVESHVIALDTGDEARVTISLGLASLGQAALDAVRLIQKADEALYRSKSDGRNRLTAA